VIDFGFPLDAALCPLYYYHQKHPVNYLLLGVFTISLAFVVGLTCAFTSGMILASPSFSILLQSLILFLKFLDRTSSYF